VKQEYTAQWRYSSSLGILAEGEKVVLSEEEAALFNQDSPGVLLPKGADTVKGRAMSGPPQHRMITGEGVQSREESGPEPEAEVIDATASAIKLAAEHGIDLASVQGTGSGGRIIKSDIDKLIE
jgi:pyruvate/2-oxoglutarate dehydrogenase complex dihydrolipoamide acyltransferase (E2) component